MLLTQAFQLGFSQGEVDFVIPRLDRDIPLRIDPFLLFKSRSEEMRALHAQLISVFDNAIELYERGEHVRLARLIDFPEANEVGLGYSKSSRGGRGMGSDLNALFISILASSKALRERRLRHIEELQLLATNIGPDRISDITANVLKSWLITYTQRQCELWNIPTSRNVPVEHILDFDDYVWRDDYLELPANPDTGDAILLVPRRMVRHLPWINYEDYFGTVFKRTFLRSRETQDALGRVRKAPRPNPGKLQVVNVTRQEVEVLDRYIKGKEGTAAKAVPASLAAPGLQLPNPELAGDVCERLRALPTGTAAAADYQKLVLEVVNYSLEPELTGGELEVRTIYGTERRDILYTNESEQTFLAYLRNRYNTFLMMFETKNVTALEMEHVNQTSTYLGERLGTFGVIATRNGTPDNVQRKCYSVFNDSPTGSKKVVLTLSDEDLCTMAHRRDAAGSIGATRFLQEKYREFIQRCQ